MNKFYFVIALLVMASLMIVGCGSENDAPTAPSIANGNIVPFADDFAYVMNDSVPSFYYVYTPPGYSDTGDPFPVLYLLHGFGGDENYFVALFSATDAADYLIANGMMDPMVIVMPNGKNALGGSFYTDSGHLAVGQAESHIMGIIPEVESNFNVSTDPEGKAIGGQSMGGYGAMNIALNNPGVFGNISALSAPISFDVVQVLLPAVLQETGYDTILTNTGGVGDSTAWANMMYPTTERTITAMMFAMSAAFSPYNPADPYFPTLLQTMISGVDSSGNPIYTPIGINLPIGHDGTIDDLTWDRWMEHDILTRFLGGQSANIDGIPLYLDVGVDDDLYLNNAHSAFATAYNSVLDDLDTDTYFEGVEDSEGNMIPADHTTHTYERVKLMLQWVSDQF